MDIVQTVSFIVVFVLAFIGLGQVCYHCGRLACLLWRRNRKDAFVVQYLDIRFKPGDDRDN